MRVSRVLMAAGLAVLVSVGSVAILSAQAKTDEDYAGPHLVENEEYHGREPYAA